MNVIDSSAWLEYFADGPNAGLFAAAIEDPGSQIVPTVSLYEVFKRILQQSDEGSALQAVVVMQQGRVIDLSQPLALRAAVISAQLQLPMADSIMLATARSHGATLWTQDSDFEHIDGVRYIPKDASAR
ncbi:MAG: type II toxin-antitoxin system VapC family toxin [bacterium]|nr:type II toxin-antitoxin system VapC family toxin [bacterium]